MNKLSKRLYLTVVDGEKGFSSPGYSGGPIYQKHQYFTLRHKHKKGSARPAGWFHGTIGSDTSVEVRWLWTEEHNFFAPEITFKPNRLSMKVAEKVGKALADFGWREGDPTQLIDNLGATVVQYMDDNKKGCWDDYRVLRIPGEPAMLTIARHAL